MRLKMTAKNLRALAASVATEYYLTPKDDLEKMKTLHQSGAVKEMGEFALDLFYQLQAPGTGADGVDPNEQSRRALMKLKEIFGLDGDTPPEPRGAFNPHQPQGSQQNAPAGVAPGFSPAPAVRKVATQPAPNVVKYPNITPEEWEARERARQLLENLLRRLAENCEKQRKAILQESLAGPSPYERAAEIAPTHPDARAMQRMQDSNFREVRRLTSLLLKLKRYERQMAALEKTAPFQDSTEKKGVSDE
jgi:hypothetical protein